MNNRKDLKRGKFPDDKRDRQLKFGNIVKMEPIKPIPETWQLEMFKSNDPRQMEHSCSTIFLHVYDRKKWGPPLKDLSPMGHFRKRDQDKWDARIIVGSERDNATT